MAGITGQPGAQGNRVSKAQSGGISNSFGGGKGGLKSARGATFGRKIGRGKFANGTNYNVRVEGGDLNLVKKTGKVGNPPPLRAGKSGFRTKIIKARIRRPQYGGGSS